MKSTLTSSVILLSLFAVSTVANAANLIVNGDMNGTTGHYPGAASDIEGWPNLSIQGEMDINSAGEPIHTFAGWNWVETPVASPNGGNWMNIWSNWNAVDSNAVGATNVSQSLYGSLTVGQEYEFSFYYARQDVVHDTLPLIPDPALTVDVSIANGVSNLYSFDNLTVTNNNEWYKYTTTFVAEGTDFRFSTIPRTSDFNSSFVSYIAIDGVSLLPVQIPEPACASLAVLACGCGLLRRRRI